MIKSFRSRDTERLYHREPVKASRRKSRMSRIKGLLIGLGGVALGLAAGILRQASRVAPDDMVSALPAPYYAVLWENDAIRLVEHRLEASATEPMHHHPRMVACFLENSTIRVTESNGTVTGLWGTEAFRSFWSGARHGFAPGFVAFFEVRTGL